MGSVREGTKTSGLESTELAEKVDTIGVKEVKVSSETTEATTKVTSIRQNISTVSEDVLPSVLDTSGEDSRINRSLEVEPVTIEAV